MGVALIPLAFGTLLPGCWPVHLARCWTKPCPSTRLRRNRLVAIVLEVVEAPATLIALAVIALGVAAWVWRGRLAGMTKALNGARRMVRGQALGSRRSTAGYVDATISARGGAARFANRLIELEHVCVSSPGWSFCWQSCHPDHWEGNYACLTQPIATASGACRSWRLPLIYLVGRSLTAVAENQRCWCACWRSWSYLAALIPLFLVAQAISCQVTRAVIGGTDLPCDWMGSVCCWL